MSPEMHTFYDLYTCPWWLATFGSELGSVRDTVNIEERDTAWAHSLPKAETCIARDGRHVEHPLYKCHEWM